jgi:adenylate cyclase
MHKPVILCVDDEPGILRSLERCLSLENYEVVTAGSGEEALKVLEGRFADISLMIVDQRMPQMMGDQLLRSVQEKYGPVKAIMLSGYADFEGLVRAVNDGHIFHFIQKPWDNAHLLKIIRAAISPE